MARKTVMGRTAIKQSEQLRTRPGKQVEMRAQPKSDNPEYKGSGKLKGKIALITGGDSGIGRAVAIAFAKEGADMAIAYLNEDKDAAQAKSLVEKHGARAIAVAGDIGDKNYCQALIDKVIGKFGKLDILINNAGEQHPQPDPKKLPIGQFERTFKTNVFGMFYLTKAALPHLKKGSTIINTASVTAYKGRLCHTPVHLPRCWRPISESTPWRPGRSGRR
jgi:short-subunit dehydrogenase involved in D-alanine esterification of teichoic acids